MARPLLAPDPRNDTTADVPYAPSYLGPRQATRTTYSAARRPVVNGRELSDEDIANIRAYTEALADEDRDRFDVGTGLTERGLAIQESAARARIEEIKQNLKQRRYEFDTGRGDRRYEFDLGYGLDRDRFGLDYAKTETDYLSTPDRAFQGRQFERSFEALGAGQRAPAYRAGGDVEQPNTAGQFAALAGTGAPRPPVVAPVPGMSTTGATTDAVPPYLASLRTGGIAPGADEMDRAEAAGTALLDRGPGGLGQGQYESLLPGTRRGLTSLMRTRGINPEDWEAPAAALHGGPGLGDERLTRGLPVALPAERLE